MMSGPASATSTTTPRIVLDMIGGESFPTAVEQLVSRDPSQTPPAKAVVSDMLSAATHGTRVVLPGSEGLTGPQERGTLQAILRYLDTSPTQRPSSFPDGPVISTDSTSRSQSLPQASSVSTNPADFPQKGRTINNRRTWSFSPFVVDRVICE